MELTSEASAAACNLCSSYISSAAPHTSSLLIIYVLIIGGVWLLDVWARSVGLEREGLT